MSDILQLIVLVAIGFLLLWFGYSLFARFGGHGQLSTGGPKRKMDNREGTAGAPRTCPVCAIRLKQGERVKSSAFPSMNGKERLMHINGCPWCLNPDNRRKRNCPVCGKSINESGYLVARLFDKPGRSHVHVIGCLHCKEHR